MKTITMPQLTPSSKPSKVWFDYGMIWFEDPENPDQQCRCSVDEYEERIYALRDMIQAQEELYGAEVKLGKRVICCGSNEFDKFFSDAKELLRDARQQIHIGMPLKDMVEESASHRPVSRRQGFGDDGYQTSAGGILIPNSDN